MALIIKNSLINNEMNNIKYSLKVNRHSTLKFKNLIFDSFVFLFLFQDWIQNDILPIFQYFDELVVLIGGVGILISSFYDGKIRIERQHLKLILSFGIFVAILILSTLINQIQNLVASISDLVLICKFFLAIFIGINLRKYYSLTDIKSNLLVCAKIITAILGVLCIASFFTDNIPTTQLCYSHPLMVCAVTVILLAIFMLNDNTKNYKWIVIDLVICFLTSKAKAYAAIFAYIALYILLKYRINKKFMALIIVLGVALVGYDQFSYYFLEINDSARRMLLLTSFTVAGDYFPLGAGLATYGSYQSSVYYSPLYYLYDLNTIWGLSEGGSFISDNFWPMVIGESGIIGAIFYVLFLYFLFKLILKIDSKNVKYAVMFVFIYLLIASTNEGSFVHYYSIPMAIFMGFFITDITKTLKKEL